MTIAKHLHKSHAASKIISLKAKNHFVQEKNDLVHFPHLQNPLLCSANFYIDNKK
jgi:hypothetical protein